MSSGLCDEGGNKAGLFDGSVIVLRIWAHAFYSVNTKFWPLFRQSWQYEMPRFRFEFLRITRALRQNPKKGKIVCPLGCSGFALIGRSGLTTCRRQKKIVYRDRSMKKSIITNVIFTLAITSMVSITQAQQLPIKQGSDGPSTFRMTVEPKDQVDQGGLVESIDQSSPPGQGFPSQGFPGQGFPGQSQEIIAPPATFPNQGSVFATQQQTEFFPETGSEFGLAPGAQAVEIAPATNAVIVEPALPPQTQWQLGFQGRLIHDYGMRILRTTYGSPAERAGLEAGDIIFRINGRRIGCVVDYRESLQDAARYHNGRIRMLVKNVRCTTHTCSSVPRPSQYVTVTTWLPGWEPKTYVGQPGTGIAASVEEFGDF